LTAVSKHLVAVVAFFLCFRRSVAATAGHALPAGTDLIGPAITKLGQGSAENAQMFRFIAQRCFVAGRRGGAVCFTTAGKGAFLRAAVRVVFILVVTGFFPGGNAVPTARSDAATHDADHSVTTVSAVVSQLS
jgi:hypothetical protein